MPPVLGIIRLLNKIMEIVFRHYTEGCMKLVFSELLPEPRFLILY